MPSYRLDIGLFHAVLSKQTTPIPHDVHAVFTFYKFSPEVVPGKQLFPNEGRVVFDAVKWCTFSLPPDELADRVAPLTIAVVAAGQELGRATVQLSIAADSRTTTEVLHRQTVSLLDARGVPVGNFELGSSVRVTGAGVERSAVYADGVRASSSKGSIGEKLQFDVCYQLKSCCEYVVCVLKKEHTKLNVKIDSSAQSCFTRLAKAVRKIVRDLNIANQLTLVFRKHAIDTVAEHQPTTLPEAAPGTVAKCLQFDVLYQLQGAVSLLGGILANPQELVTPLSSAPEDLVGIISRLSHAAANVVREVNVLVQSTLDNTLKLLKKKLDEDYSSDSSSSSSSSDDDRPFSGSPKKATDASNTATAASPPPPPPPPPAPAASTVVEDLTTKAA